MNRKNRDDKAVVCPFYRFSDHYHICCEGVSEDTSIKVTFGDPKKTENYKNCFCRNIDGYKRCRVSDMLTRKYADS